MTEYWFACYRPAAAPQRAGRGVVALNWKGWATIVGFVLGLVAGGALFLFFGLRDQFFPGIACFVVLAAAGAITFLWAGVAKTDPVRSAYDYLAERRK